MLVKVTFLTDQKSKQRLKFNDWPGKLKPEKPKRSMPDR